MRGGLCRRCSASGIGNPHLSPFRLMQNARAIAATDSWGERRRRAECRGKGWNFSGAFIDVALEQLTLWIIASRAALRSHSLRSLASAITESCPKLKLHGSTPTIPASSKITRQTWRAASAALRPVCSPPVCSGPVHPSGPSPARSPVPWSPAPCSTSPG